MSQTASNFLSHGAAGCFGIKSQNKYLNHFTELLCVVFPVPVIFQKVFLVSFLSGKNFHYVASKDGYKTEDTEGKIQVVGD